MSKMPDLEPAPEPVDDGVELLTEAVKSAILDQLLRDLRSQATHGTPHSFYAKSDSGLYGKYQKVDAPDAAILEAIRANLQAMVDEAVAAESARFAGETETTGNDGSDK